MNRRTTDKQQEINQALLEIDALLEDGSGDAAYTKYTELITIIDNKEYETSDNLKAKVYASFAFFLFEVSEFPSFFEMLIKAQGYGYAKDEIEALLYEAFIQPNMYEFQRIYEANMKFMISNKYLHTEKVTTFEDLPFWLIPTGVVDEYYLYHKQDKLIKEKIALYRYQVLHSIPTLDALSDFLLVEDWDWNRILSFTNAIRKMNKKTYIVLNNIEKSLSCLQGALLNDVIISNVSISNNLNSLEENIINSNAFLPRNIINSLNLIEQPQTIINEIHNQRIKKTDKKRANVLLSICIPSFNRGKRAYDNVTHLLNSYYDEEIEIVLSNNGTQNETKQYYDSIRDIDDARLKYYAFEKNEGFAINCCKACELATGKFILLVSDEDLVNFNVLDKVMNILNNSKETLSILRTSSTAQNQLSNIITKPGEDALLNFMLTSNYMSGIIFNNTLLKQHNGLEYIKENLDNSVCYWYPHMFWELLLCQYGKVQGTDLILINEGAAEKTEVETIETSEKIKIPYYATIEGRLEQHEGFTRIFKNLEICKEQLELFRTMYLKLSLKTLFLTIISINVYYKKTNTNVQELYDSAYEFCSSKEFYKTNISDDFIDYQTDLEAMNQYYLHFKNQL